MARKKKPRNNNQIAKASNQPSDREAGVIVDDTQIRKASFSRTYSGPIPPPAILEEFERVLPGSAERILAMAEKQSNHRQALEKTVVGGDSIRAYLGLLAGFIVALAMTGGGVFLVYSGHDWAGVSMVTTVVVGLVGVFVYGTRSRSAERHQKAEQMQLPSKRRS